MRFEATDFCTYKCEVSRRMCACAWRLHVFTAALVLAAHLIKVLSCGEAGGGPRLTKRYVGLYTGPYFDPSAPNNITTQLGTHAYLPCKVRQLSNKSVSWIRRRDAHILTVDRFTFIADERFQAFLVEATDTWTLQVKYVQARDAGVYECQVGTEPKMSHFVQLNVVVPKIEIVGESDLYVKAGTTVSLKCVITQALEEPAYIFWYHNDERVLNYDKSLVEIRMERVAPDTTVGNLIIYSPRREDSGNYSCSPSNLDSASVMLHVLSGEQPAAMQHGNARAAPATAARRARALVPGTMSRRRRRQIAQRSVSEPVSADSSDYSVSVSECASDCAGVRALTSNNTRMRCGVVKLNVL